MITFHLHGINNAAKDLLGYADSLEDKLRKLLTRLMNEGYDIASVGFTNALYSGDNDVYVLPAFWKGDTLVLAANGKAVAFIEFGSGTTYPDYPDKLPSGIVGHGEYGDKKGADPPWLYIGEAGNHGAVLRHLDDGRDVVLTNGDPPARAMYEASKVFDQEHIIAVAKEVFND